MLCIIKGLFDLEESETFGGGGQQVVSRETNTSSLERAKKGHRCKRGLSEPTVLFILNVAEVVFLVPKLMPSFSYNFLSGPCLIAPKIRREAEIFRRKFWPILSIMYVCMYVFVILGHYCFIRILTIVN